MASIRLSEQIRRWLGRRDERSVAGENRELSHAGDELPVVGDELPVVGEGVRVRFPLGHYYSPVPDTSELAAEPLRSQVWPDQPRATVAIDWNDSGQIDLCRRVFASQPRLELAVEPTDDARDFHTQNVMFPALDAWVLEAMLRYLRPARLIEVGCGFSSLITARVNRELLGGEIDVTCIDPYPPTRPNGCSTAGPGTSSTSSTPSSPSTGLSRLSSGPGGWSCTPRTCSLTHSPASRFRSTRHAAGRLFGSVGWRR
jgi:hypothetical protein